MAISDNSGPNTQAKRQILVGLSGTLTTLADRMRTHGEAAMKITLLAVRAEGFAQRAWDLNSEKNQNFQRDSLALLDDVKALATDSTNAAKRAGEEALLGREVAGAIAAHSVEIAKLASEIDFLPDSAAVRARLRPLVVTLTTLPARLKANASTIKDVNNLTALAGELAERSDSFGKRGMVTNQDAVALCRELRRFAEEASAVSTEMSQGSAMAVQVIEKLTEKTVGLSLGKPVSDAPSTAHDRMMALARNAPPKTDVWTSAAPKRESPQLPAASVTWGSADNARRPR